MSIFNPKWKVVVHVGNELWCLSGNTPYSFTLSHHRFRVTAIIVATYYELDHRYRRTTVEPL